MLSGRVMAVVTVLVFMVFVPSCSRNRAEIDESRIEKERILIDSLMRAGDYGRIKRIIEKGKTEASDSDTYFYYVSEEIGVDFYQNRADSMHTKARLLVSYLERVESTPFRDRLHGRALTAIGTFYSKFGLNPDSSLVYLERACDLASACDDRRQFVVALCNLGDANKQLGRLDRCIDLYHRAISLADSLGCDRFEYVPLYGGIAAAYTALHDFENSRRMWEETGKLWDVMLPVERFNYLNNTGNDYYLREDYPASLRQFRRLREFLEGKDEMEWERHFCDVNMTDVFLKLGMPDSAAAYMNGQEHYFTNVSPMPFVIDHIRTQQMNLLYQQGDLNGAGRLIKDYLSDRNLRAEQQTETLKFLNGFYRRVGDWPAAYRTLTDLTSLQDSLRGERLRQKASAVMMGYEHDRRILALRVSVAEKESHIRTVYLVVSLALLLIVALIFSIVSVRRRSRQKEERMLRKMMNIRSHEIRSRATPHFIYNALNGEIMAKASGRPSSLDSLVRLLRRQQIKADELVVSIGEELDFTDDYVSVMRKMVRGPFDYVVDVDSDIDRNTCMVPSMTLQIIVENAFKHGFASLPEGMDRRLEIKVARVDRYIRIDVINNYALGNVGQNGKESQGFRIIEATLQLLNEKRINKIRFSTDTLSADGQTADYIASLLVPDDLQPADGI